MTGPTQHADDRETRKLIASLPALRMSPDGQRLAVSTPHVSGTWFVVECFPDDRSDFGYVDSVKVADWVAVAKSAVGEITEAHTRNAVLRSEHRTEVEELRGELVAIGAQRDDAEDERTSMIRDLHAAQFDGATSLPDRPLDTVWEWLLDLVRNDRARLSGGNTPADAATVLLEAAMEFQAARDAEDPEHNINEDPEHNINDAYFEEQAAFQIRKLAEAGWGSAVATPADTQAGRTITVCGAVDQLGADLFCILPPEHVEHTTRDNGVTWHKAVTATGSGMEFATTPPGWVGPKLADLAGLFTPADTNYLCSAHWVRYLRGSDWWDETCERCDHVKARTLFGDEAPAPSVGADPEDEVGREAREDAEDWKHQGGFIPKLPGGTS